MEQETTLVTELETQETNNLPRVLLYVWDCRCHACGNRWTHSQPLFREGTSYGHDLTVERFDLLLKNPSLIEGIRTFESIQAGCYRCVSLGLGRGWQDKTHGELRKAYVPGRPVDADGFVQMDNSHLDRFFTDKTKRKVKPSKKIEFNLLDD